MKKNLFFHLIGLPNISLTYIIITTSIIGIHRFGGKQLAASKLATQLGEEGGAVSGSLSWGISAGQVETGGQFKGIWLRASAASVPFYR